MNSDRGKGGVREVGEIGRGNKRGCLEEGGRVV